MYNKYAIAAYILAGIVILARLFCVFYLKLPLDFSYTYWTVEVVALAGACWLIHKAYKVLVGR